MFWKKFAIAVLTLAVVWFFSLIFESDRYTIIQQRQFSSSGIEKEPYLIMLDKKTGNTWFYYAKSYEPSKSWHEK